MPHWKVLNYNCILRKTLNEVIYFKNLENSNKKIFIHHRGKNLNFENHSTKITKQCSIYKSWMSKTNGEKTHFWLNKHTILLFLNIGRRIHFKENCIDFSQTYWITLMEIYMIMPLKFKQEMESFSKIPSRLDRKHTITKKVFKIPKKKS